MNMTFQTANLSPRVLGVLAIAIVIGMLTVFHSVVEGAVQSGEFRRQAEITQADALRRCKMLRDMSARSSCMRQTAVVALSAP